MKYLILGALCLVSMFGYAQKQPKILLQQGHADEVCDALFSPDGNYLLSVDRQQTLILWGVASGKQVATLKGNVEDWDKSTVQAINKIFCPKGQQVIVYRNWHDGFSMQLLDSKLASKRSSSPIITNAMANKELEAISNDHGFQGLGGMGGFTGFGSFSTNGKYVITCVYKMGEQNAGVGTIWDIASGKVVASLKEHTKELQLARFSADGKYVITAGNDNKTIVWDAHTGAVVSRINGYKGHMVAADFSPDGMQVATGGDDQTVRLWDTKSGAAILTFKGNFSPSHIQSVCFSPKCHDDPAGGRHLVSSGSDGISRVWDVATGKLLTSLYRHATSISSSRFSPDGEYIVNTSGDPAVKLWIADGGELLEDLSGQVMESTAIGFNSNGYLKIKIGDKNEYCFFDLNTGRLANNGEDVENKSAANGTKAVPTNVKMDEQNEEKDGDRIMDDNGSIITQRTGDYILREGVRGAWIYNEKTGSLVAKYPISSKVCLSPDGKYAAVSPPDDRNAKVKIIALKNNSLVREIDGFLPAFAGNPKFFSPDNKRVLIVSYKKKMTGMDDMYTVQVYDIGTGKAMCTLNGKFSLNVKVMFSPRSSEDPVGGAYVATSSEFMGKGDMQLFDAKTGAPLADHSATTTRAIPDNPFSPDGKYSFTYNDRAIQIRNAKTNRLLSTLYVLGKYDYFNVIAEGYYQCSRNAARYLNFVTSDLKILSFEQLDVQYNRPDKVLQAIGNTDAGLNELYKRVYAKRLKNLDIDSSTFNVDYSLPETELANAGDIHKIQSEQLLRLKIKGAGKNRLSRFNIFVNDVPLYGVNGASISKKNVWDTSVSVVLSEGVNTISISVSDVNNKESARSPIKIYYKPVTKVKGKLYFIGIGIDQFRDASHNLKWCTRDIQSLASQMQDYRGEKEATILLNKDVTREHVLALKKKLALLKEDDEVILAYSGHGLLKGSDLYLSTYDVNFSDPEQNGLLYEDLENLLDNIKPRKKLVLLDACNSGRVDKSAAAPQYAGTTSVKGKKGLMIRNTGNGAEHKNSFDVMQELFLFTGKNSGTTIISAAEGTQSAGEDNKLGNGVFTHFLLDAMSRTNTLTISELIDKVTQQVAEYTKNAQIPTVRSNNTVLDWDIFNRQ